MKSKLRCIKCNKMSYVNLSKTSITPICQSCKISFDSEVLREMITSKSINRCPVCKFNDFWLDKKFPKKIGLGLVILAAVFVPITYGLSFIVLFLFDLVLWFFLPWRINCYNCESEFIGFPKSKKYKSFDLKLYDYYKEVTKKE